MQATPNSEKQSHPPKPSIPPMKFNRLLALLSTSSIPDVGNHLLYIRHFHAYSGKKKRKEKKNKTKPQSVTCAMIAITLSILIS